MMLDSGARGSKQQIKQLAGMRGLMAKPRKSACEVASFQSNASRTRVGDRYVRASTLATIATSSAFKTGNKQVTNRIYDTDH